VAEHLTSKYESSTPVQKKERKGKGTRRKGEDREGRREGRREGCIARPCLKKGKNK
jgi:hypothetical protein